MRRRIKGYRLIAHTADVGIEARGAGLPELFANAARCLFHVITDLGHIRLREIRDVEVSAPDREALLVAWLNEFLYLFDAENLVFRRFEVTELSETRIVARVHGERVDPERHPMKTGVKSATYHELKVWQDQRGYVARVILDI